MSWIANDVPGLRFQWHVLLLLLFLLVVSGVVFYWQVRRWTTNRHARLLLDWARATGFKLSHQDREPPEPLTRLPAARATTCLESGHTRLFQLETLSGSAVETPRWHVLVRDLEGAAWPPTGLRPASAKASLLDLFSLSSFPRLGETERFVVFGTDSTPARILSKSQARALLPPDIGLLLAGGHLVLDFSTRPFDPIEFGRMTAVAEQVVATLPLPTNE